MRAAGGSAEPPTAPSGAPRREAASVWPGREVSPRCPLFSPPPSLAGPAPEPSHDQGEVTSP